ncbi:MAG: hypothetical protein JWO82_3813 [Akkermansiaceae bacterium]|nr:hypothetical protein [Akkermansiaceae bacterium]
MKPKNPTKTRRSLPERGFALVITLTLLVMLTILAVGLMGLSALTMRGSSVGLARAEAKANAHMALLIALGELQKSMGPDQRVSARASSLGVEQGGRNFTGAWKSYHWQPLSNGPDYNKKADGFERWLVSTTNPEDASDFATAARSPDRPVWLINPETVGTPANTDGAGLQVSKIDVLGTDKRRGAYAWGVMDESLKAPFQLADPKTPTAGELLAQRNAPPRVHAESVSKSLAPDVLNDPQKILSLDTAVVAAGKDQGKEILGYQQDVTPYSKGLLTNVATGGLKRDLTTLLESNDDLGNILGSQYLYPQVTGDGIPTWDYLRSHYQLYNRVSGAATNQPKISLTTADFVPKTGTLAGLDRNPVKERLLPVILRFQIMFSAVSHDLYLGDRIDFYNKNGGGAANYAAPNLVYDPVMTLYNPYYVAITLTKARVRVWDPPVVFGFQKNGVWLRDEFGQNSGDGSGFQGLARFQIANEKNLSARRYFTFILGGGNSESYTGSITLQPGEVRAFSPRIEKSWSWGNEIAGGTSPRVFFDWDNGRDFGNKDGRTGNTMGVESVASWDVRAGLQTDHLSYNQARPAGTLYSFETPGSVGTGGWLAIKKTDRFACKARPGQTVKPASGVPSDHDFRVDLLAGSNPDTTRDIVRSYRFHFKDPVKEISEKPATPVITRDFLVKDIIQLASEPAGGPGKKLPFALLTMTAKTTADVGDNSKPWLYNQPVVEGVNQDSNVASNDLDSYDVKLKEVGDFNDIPNGIQCDKATGKTYYGASVGSENGSSNVPMFHVPVSPAASMGDLIPANLAASTQLPRVAYPLGNSRANPLISPSSITASLLNVGKIYDQSYLINDALWDSFFFSTAAKFQSGLAGTKDRQALLQDFFENTHPLLNTRLIPLVSNLGSISKKVSELDGLDTDDFSKTIAGSMAIEGPFNVNSDSVGAWKAVLSSLRDRSVAGWTGKAFDNKDRTALVRTGFPVAGEIDTDPDNPETAVGVLGKKSWSGFRSMDDNQINALANAIVTVIRARGKGDKAPSATLGEFVNRRVGGSLHSVKGLLETALENSKINDRFLLDTDYSRVVQPSTVPLVGLLSPASRDGYTAEGAPPVITQGDLLMALAPVITVRGDTFRIRTYGESRDSDDKVVASAWCEAIVQRIPDYVDPADQPEITGNDLKQVNQNFGRRFEIVSFRWLSPEEV